MTRNTFFAATMFCLMAMFATGANAQGRRGHNGMAPGREMHMDTRGGMEMRGRHDMGAGHQNIRHGHRDMAPGHHEAMRGHGNYHWNHDGYLHGWEGRVRRFDDGRWGYYRDGAWLYYDTFYEPDYYYAHPVAHFHAHHLSPTTRKVVGAVAGIATVAAIIGALTY